MRRYIIEVYDDLPLDKALSYAFLVAKEGEISNGPAGKQHCFHTAFHDGAHVNCIARKGSRSERFQISKPKGELK